MTLLSFSFIFVGSVAFSLGFLHLLIFLRRRDLKVDICFSCMAFAIALSSCFEIWALKADTLSAYIPLLKTTLAIQCGLWISFAWFIHYYTQSKKLWPPVLITVLYTLSLVINIFSPSTILFKEIVELQSRTIQTGEIFYFAIGETNSFRVIADIAWIILLLYTAAAFIIYSKKVCTKQAIIFSGTIFLCLGLGYLHGTLIDLGIAEPPYLGSFLFLPLSLVVSVSLAADVVKTSQLSIEIEAAESRWRNLLENVHLCVLGIDCDKNISYVNPFFLELTGYKKSEVLNHPFVNIIVESLRSSIGTRIEKVLGGQSTIFSERHLPIVTNTGVQREILWSNVLMSINGHSTTEILSIGRDITDKVQAEKARDQLIQELESLKQKLEEENISLKEMIQADHTFKEIIGKSNGLLYVLNKVQQVADTDSTVLILGETGTGKELVARAIHRESQRVDKPFIRVNCAAIPSDLVESELFGHEPGSFTNAVGLRRGKFELAEKGTIFLDEISEMPLETQAKLLNVLQEKELERVGGSQTIPVDARVISATNRDLNVEVAEGRFRADLYYRLNVYPVTLPPLRTRKEDIPLLVKHFITLFNHKFVKNIEDVSTINMDCLTNYDWPGNIRELRNILERAVITSVGSNLNLPNQLKSLSNNTHQNQVVTAELLPLTEVERQHILLTLQKTAWQISGKKGAAHILQMNPSTLRSRIKKLGLEKP
jgi:PAS domain S-box-containing protein